MLNREVVHKERERGRERNITNSCKIIDSIMDGYVLPLGGIKYFGRRALEYL
jgi:hypothetical protein